jgi:hypothetical protein
MNEHELRTRATIPEVSEWFDKLTMGGLFFSGHPE